jgi:hypothetical protein
MSNGGDDESVCFAAGACICCGKTFTFNPLKVPSIPIHGEREPVCKECIDIANERRVAMGLPKHPYAEDAYTFCTEEELIRSTLGD